MEPPPMANTQSSRPFSVAKPSAGKKGSMMVAAVIMATVDEPCAVFKTEVNKNGKRMPILPNASDWLKCSPILAAVKIAPKAPPIPIITRMPPAFSVASCKIFPVSVFVHDRLQLKASNTPIASATTGSPAAVNTDSHSLLAFVFTVIKDLAAIKRMGITMGRQDLTNEGRLAILFTACLLYTSDAADDLLCVDL